jgi:hypothetical protein
MNNKLYGFDIKKDRYPLIPTRKVEIDSSITNLTVLAKAARNKL